MTTAGAHATNVQAPVDPHAKVDDEDDLGEEEVARATNVQVVEQLQQVHRDVANVVHKQHQNTDAVVGASSGANWSEERGARSVGGASKVLFCRPAWWAGGSITAMARTNQGNGDHMVRIHDKVVLAARVNEAMDEAGVNPHALPQKAQQHKSESCGAGSGA